MTVLLIVEPLNNTIIGIKFTRGMTNSSHLLLLVPRRPIVVPLCAASGTYNNQ